MAWCHVSFVCKWECLLSPLRTLSGPKTCLVSLRYIAIIKIACQKNLLMAFDSTGVLLGSLPENISHHICNQSDHCWDERRKHLKEFQCWFYLILHFGSVTEQLTVFDPIVINKRGSASGCICCFNTQYKLKRHRRFRRYVHVPDCKCLSGALKM